MRLTYGVYNYGISRGLLTTLCHLALLTDKNFLFAAISGRKGFVMVDVWPQERHKMINKYEENESGPHIKRGGLYSPFPIPAYQVLGKAKQYQAQKVLLCLVSHLGKGSNCVYPSYTTIAKSCGMSRNSISAGLTVLFE